MYGFSLCWRFLVFGDFRGPGGWAEFMGWKEGHIRGMGEGLFRPIFDLSGGNHTPLISKFPTTLIHTHTKHAIPTTLIIHTHTKHANRYDIFEYDLSSSPQLTTKLGRTMLEAVTATREKIRNKKTWLSGI